MGIKVNVKMINRETTLKTMFVGSRTDMFGEREFQIKRPATKNALSPNLILVRGAMECIRLWPTCKLMLSTKFCRVSRHSVYQESS